MSIVSKYLYRLIRFVIKGEPVEKTYIGICSVNYGKLFENKNVIILGGSSGIGYAIARKCLVEGAKVLVTARNEDKLKRAVATLKEECNSRELEGLVWDITNVKNCIEKTAEAIRIMGGKIDCLVNSAGITSPKNIDNCTPEEWDQVFNTNLKGLFFATQAFIDFFRKQNTGGNIVMIASQAGLNAQSRPYALSKAALIHLSMGLAKELLQYQIRVNAIAPGPTISEMCRMDPQGDLRSGGRGKRIILPEEVAETAIFLMSDASKCITGEVIACNEGNSIRSDAFT